MAFKIILVCLGLLSAVLWATGVFDGSAWTASPGIGSSSTTSPAAVPAPKPEPPARLSEELTIFPQRFESDKIREVYREMHGATRTEFETTAEYNARRQKLKSERAFVFVTQPLSAKYDADRACLVVRMRVDGVGASIPAEDDPALLPIETNTSTSTYPASNAFGVSVNVTRTIETVYGIAASPVRSAIWRNNIPSEIGVGRFIVAEVPMVSANAKTLLPRAEIRVIYWTSPSDRSKATTFSGSYEWKPTISNPTSRVTESFGVLVDVASVNVWVVDQTSGSILLRTDLRTLLKLRT